MYEPADFMDESDLNDYQVRQHLYAQRRLADADQIDTKVKVAKMLAEVTPGRQVCGMSVTIGAVEGEKAKRTICGRPGVRMLALTGDWTCGEHDPLRKPGPGTTRCCGLEELVPCGDRNGIWQCTAGITGHGWSHRHTRLGR